MGGSRLGAALSRLASPLSAGLAFEPRLHVSPYRLYRWLHERRSLTLYDLRSQPGPLRFAAALPYPGDEALASSRAQPGHPLILIDDDGHAASALTRGLQLTQSTHHIRALYGGLVLYDHCLDPRIVGPHRFLQREGPSC